MNASILFKTKGKNNYLYDFNLNTTILIQPLLAKICLGKSACRIETANEQEIFYYKSKYEYLRMHGWFSKEHSNEKTLLPKMSPNIVHAQIHNIRQITFEITDSCNLNCKYCSYGEMYENYDRRSNKYLKFKDIQSFLINIIKLQSSKYNKTYQPIIDIGFYGGEPLLNFDFISDVVAFIKKQNHKHLKFIYSMTTNGLLLNRYIDFIVENNFKLLISLDGDKYQNEYRCDKAGKSTFDQVFNNINMIKNNYPNYFSQKVNFNAVLHDKNSIENIYCFFRERYNKIPLIGEINTNGIRLNKKHLFNKIHKTSEDSLKEAQDAIGIAKELFMEIPLYKNITTFIHQYCNWTFKNYNDFFKPRWEKTYFPTGTCIPFSRRIFVTVYGKLLPCERIGQQYHLGKIDEIINVQKIAKQYSSFYSHIIKQCKNCYFYKSCTQCLFNMSFVKKKIECSSYANAEQFNIYLSSVLSFFEDCPTEYYRILDKVFII